MWTHSLPFCFWPKMAKLSKGHKQDNFESHNSLKLSFNNIWGIRWNFVEYETLFESNFPDILTLCQTNLDDSIDSGNFSVSIYLSLIWKDSVTHMHGLAVYVNEGLPFAGDLSLENSANSYLSFCVNCDVFTENSSVITNDTQKAPKYPDHLLDLTTHLLIGQHNGTRKHLFLNPPGDR